jgi:hypothetical protein
MAVGKYHCKDVDMLVVSNVVMENFNKHKASLVAKRSSWADPYAKRLQHKIDAGLELLGVNTKDKQTKATRELLKQQKQAVDDLGLIKVQLEVDFEDDPTQLKLMEDQLGFTRHYDQVQKGDQEALIQLLSVFKKNMSPELKQQIEEAGSNGQTIEDLIAMRDQINEMNIRQESLKGSTTNDTALNVEEMNAIYKQVIGICKIAPRLLPDVPTASEDFSFARILSRLS